MANRRGDVACDVMDDSTRWLTYQELADARDINRRSAVRLAQRRRWLRRRSNDGITRVAVPVGEDQPKHDDGGDDACDVSGEDGDDISRIICALEVVVAPLREQLDVTNRRAERAEQDRTRAEERADLAEAARDAAQTGLMAEKEARARAEGMTGAAVTRAERAEHERDELRADLDRAEERLRQAEIDQLVAAAEGRSWLFRRLWRGRGG